MNSNNVRCTNMNHSRSNPPVAYCPSCGERFKTTSSSRCDDDKHRSRRKERNFFCCDCGKDLSK